MTFTVTPQPWNEPPRVRIDVDSDDPLKPFTSLQVLRDGKPIREQPFIGSSQAVAFDYEAPFGVPVTYAAAGSFASYSAQFSESWGTLAGWTTYAGSPIVTGSHLSRGSVVRSLTFPDSGRLVSQGLVVGAGGLGAQISFGCFVVAATATQAWVQSGNDPLRVVTGLGSPFTLLWDSSKLTLMTLTGTWSIPRGESIYGDSLGASSNDVISFVEDFSLSTPILTALTFTATATLNVPDAWLIHPSKPALSIPIEMGETGTGVRFIEASSGEQKTSAAVATVHRAVGRARAVVITSGPRQADEWTLVIGAETIAAKNAVRAVVDDQTPLLIRSHPDMNMDLPDDWYSVGDFTVNRVETPIITEMTLMNLPLTPVDEPVVRQGALWSWSNVLTSYATWADVLADNDTWLDVLAGPS